MSAYTQRPLTEDERQYAQFMFAYMQRFTKMGPMLAVWRLFLCIGLSTMLTLFLVLGIFGQHPLTIGLAMLSGFTLGNSINRAWERSTQRARQEWETQWAEQREQWEQVLNSGVIEVLTIPITEYVLVGSEDSLEEDCVALISVGESETLCLFTAELDTEVTEGFPGRELTVTRFPVMGNIYQVNCTGTPPKPLCTLKWSDFAGFSTPESFYGWLVHGNIYPLALDRLEQELISLE